MTRSRIVAVLVGVVLALVASGVAGLVRGSNSQAATVQDVNRNTKDIEELSTDVGRLVRTQERLVGRLDVLLDKLSARTALKPTAGGGFDE